MANITKLVIERSSSDVQFATVHKAVVRRQGSRSLDTADITIPSKYKVDENDKSFYLQKVKPIWKHVEGTDRGH